MSKRRKRHLGATLGRPRRRRRALAAIQLMSVMMMSLLLLLLLVLLLFCISSSAERQERGRKEEEKKQQEEETLIIRTDLGQLFRGTKRADSRVAAFQGLRYAGAPVKRLRFMPPTPFTYAPAAAAGHASSSNQLVHDARRPGPICMQRFPVDFTRQQLDYMNDHLRQVGGGVGGASNRNQSNESKFNLQLELMNELLPSGSFFAHRKWRPNSPGRKLLQLDQSEDCLNLNIYTPIEALKDRITPTPPTMKHLAPGKENNSGTGSSQDHLLLPVLVLIQADSFDYGSPSATISTQSAAQFARDNRLLVITFNFRLNLLGFPPPPPPPPPPPTHKLQQHITQQSRAHHNNNKQGQMEKVALLHWLQANVRSFGGSPRNVTLMGVRMGAICVNLLMLSPLAKGLFSRAILEDGAALSPMVANNLQFITTTSSLQQHLQQQQVALQHVRLIAQLSGCPGNSGDNFDASLMFECLKSAPVEQVMQQIPFGLLETGSAGGGGGGGLLDGQVVLARRWHRPLELLFRTIIELDHRLVSARFKMSLNEFSNQLFGSNHELTSTGNQQVTVNRLQLDKLVAYLIITRQAISSSSSSGGGSSTTGSSGAAVELVSELLDDLLNAIYLPSNETLVAPLYAPHLDTSLLLQQADQDLTSALLAPRSLFSRYDLLIGSTRPLVDLPSSGSAGGAGGNQLELPADVQLTDLGNQGRSHHQLSPSLPVERFGRRVMEQVGLSDEQAIQQVNLFVRSFYRFHQQEIANSIINHYFLNDKNELNATGNSAGDHPNNATQLHLLGSLINLYQDSLISVPLIKTALIHSMKQLEALADLYIGQRLAVLDERLNLSYATGNDSSRPLASLSERESLAESASENFRPFLRQLYTSPTLWPLHLMSRSSPGGVASARFELMDKIHSTYLYQFDEDVDSFALLEQILQVINQLAQELEHQPKGRAILLAEVRRKLVDGLLKPMLQHQYTAQRLSLSCGLQATEVSELNETTTTTTTPPMEQLHRWQCAQIGRKVVAHFVAHGNVNVAQPEPQLEPIELKLAEYEANCVQQQQQQQQQQQSQVNDTDQQEDHHLVIAVSEEGVDTSNTDCDNQLTRLSMDYLISKLSLDANNGRQKDNQWRVFDVFEQQMVSLSSLSVTHEPAWTNLNQFVNNNNNNNNSAQDLRARQHLDRKIAFWANFIPTLNCSRTQPIGPASLQLFSQAPNSTLLNMNLNFNCQSGGTRTVNSLLRTLDAKIKTTISEHLNRLSKQQQQLRVSSATNGQNHHSLRMATTTGNEQLSSGTPTSSGTADEATPEHRNHFGAEGNISLVSTWFTVDGEQQQQQQQSSSSLFFLSANSKHQTLLGLWLLAGAILLASTILTSGCVLMKHLKRQRSPQANNNNNNNKTISLSIISTSDTAPPQPVTMLEVLPLPAPVPVDCSGSTTTPSSSSTSASLGSQQHHQQHHQQQQQQQQQQQNPIYEHNHHHQNLIPAYSDTFEQQQQQHSEDNEQQFVPMPIIQNNRYQIEHLPECPSSSRMQNGSVNMESMGQVFSSGSEATTTTQRAMSSVSLLSSSTITNNNNNNNHATMNGNGTAKQQVKKRVKISDPKRTQQQFEGNGNTFMITNDDHLLDLNSTQPVYLNGDFLVPQLEGQQMDNFCPLHRSSSTYLISSGASLNQALITNNNNNNTNCDINLNDTANQLDFLSSSNNNFNGQFSGYLSGSESFNGPINNNNQQHYHQHHQQRLTTTTPQPLALSQLGSQQEIYQANQQQMRSLTRKQQRRVKQTSGTGRVCLVYNRIGLNNDVMNDAGTSDQHSRNTNTLDR